MRAINNSNRVVIILSYEYIKNREAILAFHQVTPKFESRWFIFSLESWYRV